MSLRRIRRTAAAASFTVAAVSCVPVTGASPCHDAVDRIWQRDRAWAHGTVQRESHGNPAAQNKRSTAAGCFQLMRSHADLIPGGWAMRYDPVANVTGAWNLYTGSGRRAWT